MSAVLPRITGACFVPASPHELSQLDPIIALILSLFIPGLSQIPRRIHVPHGPGLARAK